MKLFELQWGRARASAEILLPSAAVLRPLVLQWGRARASAEIRKILLPDNAFISASMGPRSCERGNRHWLRPATLAAHRFNGAALVRARKSVTGTAAPPVLDPSFNGAALVRARKSPGEQIPRARLTALQWGRARASAEMPSFGFSLSHHPMLQWGRARASAEI